jgi:hypothetical protein
MAGTVDGGKKAAQTNKERYGKDFYKKISTKAHEAWVRNGRKPRGFEYMAIHDPDKVSEWGRQGGRSGRRGSAKGNE